MPAEVNPFEDDIVTDPRRIERAVQGLNDVPLRALLRQFPKLVSQPPPRQGLKSSHAQLIVSPEAGYGKSHLIGRLFREIEGRATRVYIKPFEDAASPWKSILDRVVHEIKSPERSAAAELDWDEPTQLDELAHGVITHVMADLVAQGVLPTKQARSTVVEELRQGKLSSFREARIKPHWRKTLGSVFERDEYVRKMATCIDRRVDALNHDGMAWLQVLYGYSWSGDQRVRKACLEWLRGHGIDEDMASRIGLAVGDRPPADPTVGGLDELAKNRILDLCRLAGFYRPFVFCFDDTENYARSPELVVALGNCIHVLTRQGDNQLTLFTVNQIVLDQRLKVHWEGAHRDDFGSPHVLDGIDSPQARQLILHRLEGCAIAEEQIERFLSNSEVLTVAFGSGDIKKADRIGVRSFLRHCSRGWQAFINGPVVTATLADLFAEHCVKLASRPRLVEFNRDILRWLVQESAQGLEGIEVGEIEPRPGQKTVVWRKAAGAILFDFNGDSHWQRWKAVAERAGAYCSRNPNTKIVYLRTPELDPIPIPGRWPKIGPMIEDAKRRFLHILPLTRDETAWIYAGYELHSDARQGNIDFDPTEVASFLRQRLISIWRRIQEKSHPEPVPLVPPEPEKTLVALVRQVVKRERFMSLDDLVRRLPEAPHRDTVLTACGAIPAIAMHRSPRMVMLLWRSGSP